MAVASNNAILNIGRLNAFRLNYLEPGLKRTRDKLLTITLDGAPLKVRLGSLQIHDVINDAPNTCTCIVDNATPPTTGQRLRVVLGVDPAYLLFAGPLQASRVTYVGRAANNLRAWQCEAVDDTNRTDWLRPFGAWQNISATTVAQQIIATFAPGYSSAGVQAGLPAITLYLDGTERMGGALKLIAKLIGGYYYVEDKVLHLFVGSEPGAVLPDPVDGRPHQLLDDPSLTYETDDSQIRTRCYGKGHGEATLTAVDANETRLPIADAVMFPAAGGQAIAEWQRLTYTGMVAGGTGALVGPGVAPSAALVLAITTGSGVTPGAHTYAYTFKTAAGESIPSPLAAITVSAGAVGAPSAANFSVSSGVQLGGPPAGTVMDYRFYIGDGATFSPSAPGIRITSTGHRPQINFVTTADMRGRYVFVYRNDNTGVGWGSIAITGPAPGYTTPYPLNQPIGYGQQWTDSTVYFGGGAPSPPAGGDLMHPSAVNVAGLAVGPAGTTDRLIYRSKAGTSAPLLFVGGMGGNTITATVDTAPDSALGAAAPTVDTSGLQMTAGQVLPGAAAMPVSSAAWALPAGGWAVVGNGQQVIRYTGIAGNTITGIPATGNGAILAAVNYNSTITGAPMLLGVTGNASPIAKGTPVNIWVQVDDVDAQTALASRVGGAGVIEHLIQDERRGEPSLLALCNADLALYGRPIVTVRYTTFDPKTKSGRPVLVSIPQLNLYGTLMIQDVTIATGTGPARFAVTASSIRTSLEDLLRQLVGTLEEGF